ncbi:MAG: response regulator transcription factor [Chitinophagaceae bacterium]|nr:response regulator transcription factor [Chitinophagaceae bacterium]
MNIVIIEDEKPAAEKLLKAIQKADAKANVVVTLGSIAAAVDWLQQYEMPHLIFMDIELTDGLSFQLFDKINITCPVIFCTAYDEYWQQAFEHNSIDYLLKPVKQEKLETALGKYEKLKQYFSGNLQQLLQSQAGSKGFKKRFLVKRGMDYISIKTEEIAYFYATHKLVCLVDVKNQKFILDESLTDIEKELDPAVFYRVNRKYLVQVTAIQKIKSQAKGKLLLELQPSASEEIIISQEGAAAFKEWMGK